MALSKFDKVVGFMNSFLPFVELHAPDNNYTALPIVISGKVATIDVEGNYAQFIEDTVTLYSGNYITYYDEVILNCLYSPVTKKTTFYLDNSISANQLLIKNEDINGKLDVLIAKMAYQMAIRFNIAFGKPLPDLEDEANYDDVQLSVIAQMCCVYYLQRALYSTIFDVNFLNKQVSAAATISESSNASPNFYTYLKKAKADVVEVEYGGMTGQDMVTSKIISAGLNASVDSAGFIQLMRSAMSNLHRMANQTMIDYYDFMIDYSWDDSFNDSYVIRRYSTRHDDLLNILMG
jgi:hypothetical protein